MTEAMGFETPCLIISSSILVCHFNYFHGDCRSCVARCHSIFYRFIQSHYPQPANQPITPNLPTPPITPTTDPTYHNPIILVPIKTSTTSTKQSSFNELSTLNTLNTTTVTAQQQANNNNGVVYTFNTLKNLQTQKKQQQQRMQKKIINKK
ncbi:hypothetical protein Pcinc_014767 [Petrolisthes cinctipes]|uniref:Uncharacterized protein n=1 Tax=Petrolisthes cinctipes TaxID=88211 RepID=A0AAE1FUF0_PETCI|nr:hypothetical protein Pcinc_014767 [Petrolisthes cinctipes]